MKKCPTCGKEFEDSMKFCQVDGTPLADAEPALDPYATMVGHKIDLTPEPPKVEVIEPAVAEEPVQATEPVVEQQIHETTGSIPIAPPDEVLEMPGLDPLKTMYVSPSELKEVFAADEAASVEESVPEAGSPAPPPSPFAMPETPVETAQPLGEMETVLAEPSVPPFQVPDPAPVAEWSPPPVPDAAWQNQEIGSNTPFQPPPAGAAAENKTLPIISLILGIVSLCCYMSPITGIAALITGFLALKNIGNDPNVYGGKPLAIAGMVLGGLFFLIGIVYWIFLLFFGGLAMIMDAAR